MAQIGSDGAMSMYETLDRTGRDRIGTHILTSLSIHRSCPPSSTEPLHSYGKKSLHLSRTQRHGPTSHHSFRNIGMTEEELIIDLEPLGATCNMTCCHLPERRSRRRATSLQHVLCLPPKQCVFPSIRGQLTGQAIALSAW